MYYSTICLAWGLKKVIFVNFCKHICICVGVCYVQGKNCRDKKIYILHDCLSMSRPGGRKNEYLLVQNKCVKKKVKNEKKEK